MILTLPLKTRQLINHYLNLRIGDQKIQCPYYQNVTGKRSKPVFVGKGLPEEIEEETLKLFVKLGRKDINRFEPDFIRYTMLMAGIGIDCSGLVVRILDTLLKEKGFKGIKQAIKPANHPISYLRWLLKTYTNISANTLTSDTNCVNVSDLNNVLPGDLIRFGRLHVAIITEVEKINNSVKSITYCHSTSDYYEKYGVRIGKIRVIKPNIDLEKQEWQEEYRNRNWTLRDYANKISDSGIRRLKILQ